MPAKAGIQPAFFEFMGPAFLAKSGRKFRDGWTLGICDNITFHMDPHHHHHPGHSHPPATVSPSILRLSALERLAAVAVLIVALWGAVALGDR